jgi:hypothetical protein
VLPSPNQYLFVLGRSVTSILFALGHLVTFIYLFIRSADQLSWCSVVYSFRLSGGILTFDCSSSQLSPAVTKLTDVSCSEQLFRIRGVHGDIATDTRYSSRTKRANEITTIFRNARAGTYASCLLNFTPSLALHDSDLSLHLGNREGGIIARHHLLKDTGSGAKQHPLRTYMGTSNTAEGDATEHLLNQLKVPFHSSKWAYPHSVLWTPPSIHLFLL